MIMPYLGIELRQRVSGTRAGDRGLERRGLMDPIHPVHLLFSIWAMTQTYADFDVQIRAVLGKVSIDDAEFAVGDRNRGRAGAQGLRRAAAKHEGKEVRMKLLIRGGTVVTAEQHPRGRAVRRRPDRRGRP